MKLESIKKSAIIGGLGALAFISGCSISSKENTQLKEYDYSSKKPDQPFKYDATCEKEDDKPKKDSLYNPDWMREDLAIPSWKKLPL